MKEDGGGGPCYKNGKTFCLGLNPTGRDKKFAVFFGSAARGNCKGHEIRKMKRTDGMRQKEIDNGGRETAMKTTERETRTGE